MKALIVVDIQNDFLPGGPLGVPGGNEILPIANSLMADSVYGKVIATQDWHPADHKSFAANHDDHVPGEQIEMNGLPQVLWPVHCVQDSIGAEFATELTTSRFDAVFRKGTDSDIDSYSGFFDNGKRHSTGLGEFLQSEGVREVDIIGLATDYCVKFTALDAVAEGFETTVITSGCRGVNLEPGDVDKAIEEMREKGVKIR